MVRTLHRIVGIVMLLPFVAWAATGAVFFTKPGYGAAYDTLQVRTYPIESVNTVRADPAWREMRYVRTILGLHLLVRTDMGWGQLDPVTLRPAGVPADGDIKRLVTDAFAVNPERYGDIVSLAGLVATTDTGTVITLDWNRLGLEQRGRDTDRIDLLYRIHYLQWTGQTIVDRVLGLAGLSLLTILTLLGARLAFRRG